MKDKWSHSGGGCDGIIVRWERREVDLCYSTKLFNLHRRLKDKTQTVSVCKYLKDLLEMLTNQNTYIHYKMCQQHLKPCNSSSRVFPLLLSLLV